jgi:CheY-like chemotaxis protein/HPt (histidine-containing phosphotransfer) domain-containing protein
LVPVNQGGVDDFGLPPGVRDEYLQGARDQLGTIAELAERLIARGDDTDAIEALRRDAHRLRGSAGSFGFPQATVVAGELEMAAKQWLEHPANGGMKDRGQEARTFVRRLAAALFTKQPSAPPPAPAQALPEPSSTALDRPPPPSTALPEAADVPEVIVVEDDPTLAELLTFGLEARGYRFVHYRNGREALEALRVLETHGQTPLLLLDVDLPALDGYSIFEALQQDCPGKYRVVFTTVHGSETEQLRGLEAGALDYMVKPMSLRVALEKIRRWVGR